MSSNPPRLDKNFLHRQRQRLVKLREELLRTIQANQSEQADLHAELVDEAHEFEDDAQKLAMLENEKELIDRNRQRLRDIERALQKIDDGTYGLSDASGEPIARERLEAVPEAIYTVSELRPG